MRTLIVCLLAVPFLGCQAPSGQAYRGVPQRHHSPQKLDLAIARAKAQPRQWRIGIDPVAVPASNVTLAEARGAHAASLSDELSALFSGFVRGTGAFVVLPYDSPPSDPHMTADAPEIYLCARVLELKLGGIDNDPNAYTLRLALKAVDLRTGRTVFESESKGYVRRGTPLRFAGQLSDDPALLAASKVPMEHLFVDLIDRVY